MLAQDTSSSEETIVHAVETLHSKNEKYGIIVLLQPTSPLRDSKDIDNAIKLMIEKNATAVISVTNIGVKPFKSFYLNGGGYLECIYKHNTANKRRQELPDAYLSNGAIYAVRTDEFMKSQSLLPQSTIPYIMSQDRSIDIDTVGDLIKVEKILQSKL